MMLSTTKWKQERSGIFMASKIKISEKTNDSIYKSISVLKDLYKNLKADGASETLLNKVTKSKKLIFDIDDSLDKYR